MLDENFRPILWAHSSCLRPSLCKSGTDTPPRLGNLETKRKSSRKMSRNREKKIKKHKPNAIHQYRNKRQLRCYLRFPPSTRSLKRLRTFHEKIESCIYLKCELCLSGKESKFVSSQVVFYSTEVDLSGLSCHQSTEVVAQQWQKVIMQVMKTSVIFIRNF